MSNYEDEYEDENEDENETPETPVLDTELANQMRAVLGKVLGLTDGDLERQLERFSRSVVDSLTKTLTSYTEKLVGQFWKEHLELGTRQHIEKVFQKALGDKVLTEESNSYVHKECQEIVLSRVKQWLSSNWDAEKKRKEIISNSLTNLISVTVDKNVTEAIDEIKAETIDKFQKDVMKKMMMGMAREIAQDKKLLALMSE